MAQWNLCGTTAAQATAQNPAFFVRAVQDPSHFTIERLDHSSVSYNAPWCTGSAFGATGGPQFGGKVAPYTLPAGPKGGVLDGWNGYWTRKFTIRPINGLVSLTVAGNVVTMTTSFVPDLAVGDKVGIWGTGSAALNNSGKPWTVQTAASGTPNTVLTLTSTTAGAIVDGDYTVNKACGPAGADNCVSVSARAWHGNIYYDGSSGTDLVSACNQFATSVHDYDRASTCTLMYLVNPAWTAQPNNGITTPGGVLEILRDIEHHLPYTGGTIWSDETKINGGVGDGVDQTYAAWQYVSFYFSLLSDWLTPGERQHVLDVFLNDLPDGCTKNLPTAGAGTITRSGTTITGSGTAFTSFFAPGDYLLGQRGRDSGYPYDWMYKIISVDSDTQLTVALPNTNDLNATPSAYYLLKQWSAGSCGFLWYKKHWTGSMFAHPAIYPTGGGEGAYPGPYGIGGSNNQYSENMALMSFGAAASDFDPRGAALFSAEAAIWWDKQLAFSQQYITGFNQSGASYYGYNRTPMDGQIGAAHVAGLIPSLDLDLAGPWTYGIYLNIMYAGRPDWPTCQLIWAGPPAGSSCPAADGSPGFSNGDPSSIVTLGSPYTTLYRSTRQANYFWDWLSAHKLAANWVNSVYADRGFTWMDPRQSRLDYTQQPTQYLFRQTSAATCKDETGTACQARADTVASRTGWTSPDDTAVLYLSRSFIGDHDQSEAGAIRLYKRQYLIFGRGGDSGNPDNTSQPILSGTDYRYVNPSPSQNPTTPYITRWAKSDPYGDVSSRYVYAMSDLTGLFLTAPNLAQRHFIHLKKAGTEEIVAQVDKVDASNLGGTVKFHVHYWQVGAGSPKTTCGTNTCTTQESGVTPYMWGTVSNFLTPSSAVFTAEGTAYPRNEGRTYRVTISGGTTLESMIVHRVTGTDSLTLSTTAVLTDATHYVVQADDKVIGIGRGSGLVTGYPAHAVASGTTQILYTDLDPGIYTANIGGTQLSCTVANNDHTCYLEPPTAGGVLTLTRTSTPALAVTGNQPSFAWSAGQALPGQQSVSAACSGTTCAELAAAGSMHWITPSVDRQDTTATVTVSVDPGGLPPGNHSGYVFVALPGVADSPFAVPVSLGVFGITTAALPPAFAGLSYSQTIVGVAGTEPYAWNIVSGGLPDGLSLTPAGEITGTPTTGGSFPFTVQCTGADGRTASRDLTLQTSLASASTLLKNVGLRGVTIK